MTRSLPMSILPRRAVIALIASLTLVTATGTAWAHHGWSEYDARKRTTLTGTIRELHFVNPHATIVLETPDKTWSVMLDSPARLQNRGVTVEGLPHKTKDGEFRAERLMLGGKTIELR